MHDCASSTPEKYILTRLHKSLAMLITLLPPVISEFCEYNEKTKACLQYKFIKQTYCVSELAR